MCEKPTAAAIERIDEYVASAGVERSARSITAAKRTSIETFQVASSSTYVGKGPVLPRMIAKATRHFIGECEGRRQA